MDTEALEYASFINYHLALLKAYDACQDSKGIKKLICKAAYWLMSKNKKYLQKKKSFETIAVKLDELCRALYQLEQNECNDYDSCSAIMGMLLYEVAANYLKSHACADEEKVLDLARHLGMWTYLIDAYDDFEEDYKVKRFNPLNSFSHKNEENGNISICLEAGELMLNMMTMNLIQQIRGITVYRHQEIIENIICYGTRGAMQSIKKKREKKDGCSCKK